MTSILMGIFASANRSYPQYVERFVKNETREPSHAQFPYLLIPADLYDSVSVCE